MSWRCKQFVWSFSIRITKHNQQINPTKIHFILMRQKITDFSFFSWTTHKFEITTFADLYGQHQDYFQLSSCLDEIRVFDSKTNQYVFHSFVLLQLYVIKLESSVIKWNFATSVYLFSPTHLPAAAIQHDKESKNGICRAFLERESVFEEFTPCLSYIYIIQSIIGLN